MKDITKMTEQEVLSIDVIEECTVGYNERPKTYRCIMVANGLPNACDAYCDTIEGVKSFLWQRFGHLGNTKIAPNPNKTELRSWIFTTGPDNRLVVAIYRLKNTGTVPPNPAIHKGGREHQKSVSWSL